MLEIICAVLAVGFVITLVSIPRLRKAVVAYLERDKMPIWLSLTLAVGAAGGTYLIAPLLNQDFEFQKNRSAHLLQTVTDLNKLSVDLAIDVRRFDESLFFERRNIDDRRGELLDKITELQWRLIDVDVVITRAKSDDSVVKELSAKLDNLRRSAVEAKKPVDQERVITASLDVARSARMCVTALYKAANLDQD